MRWIRSIVIVTLLGLLLTLPSIETEGKGKRVETVTIMAESLKGNRLKDTAEQDLMVCLPPSYFDTEKRYPVVYYLHGYTRSPRDIASYTSYFDEQMKATGYEFIIVGVNGNNKFQGSFYVNSPVTGNWEDYVARDVVTYVDSNYRTIPKSDARGISGWSMGGFAAINLAMKHPDIFSSVYSIGPGLFDETGLREAFRTWDNNFLTAYGAAFAPNLEKSYPFSDSPKFNDTDSDKTIQTKWENGFGNLRQKIEAYHQLKTPLKRIKILYGRTDYYTWIPKGCVYFSKLLQEYSIPYELTEFSGGHEQSVIKESFVPFFSDNLKWSE